MTRRVRISSSAGAHLDEIGVVAHEGAGGAQVDDAARLRTLGAVGMDVRHDVVPQNFFLRLGHLEVDVLDVRPQLLDLRLADVQSHLRLASASATHRRRQV